MNLNTITIKRLKAFLNWSFEKGYHKNLKYKSKKWSTPEKEGTVIYLTWNELQKLIKYPFEKEVHRKARDFFCFGCLTGQRYSDITKLTKDNVSNNEIKIIQDKTKKAVIVPMYPGLQTIIDRYPEQYRLLPKFSNQKINKYIKEACKIAEINTPTEYKEFPKYNTTIETAPKYQMVGTHTARKTFVCLAYEKGLTIPDIKEITGIEQEKTLKRYLTISTENKRGKLTKAFSF
jgi:integrase